MDATHLHHETRQRDCDGTHHSEQVIPLTDDNNDFFRAVGISLREGMDVHRMGLNSESHWEARMGCPMEEGHLSVEIWECDSNCI